MISNKFAQPLFVILMSPVMKPFINKIVSKD